MKSSPIVILLSICLLGFLPATSIAKPFVILGTDTPDTLLDDNEVFDQATGLIWQRCAFGSGWNGTQCGGGNLPINYIFTHEDALLIAKNATPATKAWRLPNIKELSSIVDRTQFDPSIDDTTFPNTLFDDKALPPAFVHFWSSTPSVQDSSEAFGILFSNGNIMLAPRTDLGFIRLVRESEQFIK